MADVSQQVLERVAVIDKGNTLIGVLAQPRELSSLGERMGLLFLNAGIIHRVGTNRLYVKLARALATAGLRSLRFDLSGIGDSPPRKVAITPIESAMLDIHEAGDWLAESCPGIQKVCLVGHCSGADHAVMYANRDSRIAGLVLIDPSVPKTLQFQINSVKQKIARAIRKPSAETMAGVVNVFKRKVSHDHVVDELDPAEEPLSDEQVRELFVPHYTFIAQRAIPTLVICTGRQLNFVNYQDQFRDAFSAVTFGAELTIRYFQEFDHTFPVESHREQLRNVLLEWIQTVPLKVAPKQAQSVLSKQTNGTDEL